MGVKVTNNAYGTLSAGISTSDTTITLDSGQGSRFPTLGAGDYFFATLIDTANNLEIVKVTARSSDSMTVTRAQDNTTAQAFSIGDRFELRPVAALFEDIISSAELANDTSPQLSGDLDTNSNNVNFTDGDKAQFGDANDLQIYHTGTESVIVDTGTGNLAIQSDANTSITSADGTTLSARFRPATHASLYYNGSEKLATTDTGISVTGGISNKGVWVYCGEHYQTSDVGSYNIDFASLNCDITLYDVIKIEFMNMMSTSSATFNFRYRIAGSTLTAANYRWCATRNYYDGTTLSDNTNGGWDTNYARLGYLPDSTAHFGWGELWLPYPDVTNNTDAYIGSIERHWWSHTKGCDGSSRPMLWTGTGRHTLTDTTYAGDLTGVNIFPSAGNFRQVHFRVFGRLKR
jgi:hypothetical protein